MTTGQKIKQIREMKNISQRELGEMLNKSQGTIAKYENDLAEMDYATLKTFCNYAGCSIDYLLGRVDHPKLEIKKAPPESGAEEVETEMNSPDKLTTEEIKIIRAFLENMKK